MLVNHQEKLDKVVSICYTVIYELVDYTPCSSSLDCNLG